MPTLKASERRLLTLFGVVIIGLFTYFFVVEYLMREYTQVKAVNVGKERELLEKRSLMARAAETLPKRDWLEMSQPVVPAFILAAERLERFVVNSAEREGLALKDIGTVGEEREPYYHSVLMEVEARGSIEAIVRWLAALQDQEAFRAVTRCEISPVQKKDPTELKCEARIEQWYAPAGSELAMGGPERPAGVVGSEDDGGAAEGGSQGSEASPSEAEEGGEDGGAGASAEDSGAAGGEDTAAEPAVPGAEAPSPEPRRVLLPGASRDGGRRPVAPPPAGQDVVEEEGEGEVQPEQGEGEAVEPVEGDAGGESPESVPEGGVQEIQEVPAGEDEGAAEDPGAEGASEEAAEPEGDEENGEIPTAAATGRGAAVFVTGMEIPVDGAIPVPAAA